VFRDRAQIFALAGRLRLDDAPQPGEDDLHRIGGRALASQLPVGFVGHEALDVVHLERLAHAREIDQRLRYGAGALDRRRGTGERQAVAPQRDAHAQPARQLEQIGIVHAGQRQRIHAFHGQTVDDVVAHGTTLI